MENKSKTSEKAYTFDEAISLAGIGWYNIGLMMTLALSLLAMSTDMFGFAIVVTLSSCDLQLDQVQKGILVTVPFVGPVITAYAWGYVSDTRGRRLSLLIGMMGSFLMSTLCAFSPNWIVMAIFKLMGTCFSSCAQSACYALLGESCPSRVKSILMLIMSCTIHLGAAVYFLSAYLITKLDFAFDLGFITFVPWRLVILVLALPLGITAFNLSYFYESPKFLLNLGREDEALDVLRKICKRNGRDVDSYPVYKLVLDEEGNVIPKDVGKVSLLESLRNQTLPLFKPPLLKHTVLLYYLIFVAFASSSSFYMWMPFLSSVLSASPPNGTQFVGLCDVIQQSNSIAKNPDMCIVDQKLMIAATASSFFNSFLNVLVVPLSSHKKILMFCILASAGTWCLLASLLTDLDVASVFYFGILTGGLSMGPLFTYFVELFPTSYRGMAACIGVMMARTSSIIGVNVVGPLITSHCDYTFYGCSALLFSGALMALLLPNKSKKVL